MDGDQVTHGMCVAAGGSTAAGDTVIGTITLPAGGPWAIYQVWVAIALATATAAESAGGHLRINSVSGDVDPNPAPTRFPTGQIGSILGAASGQAVMPVQIFDVDFLAQGKAVIELIYNEASAVTVATQVVCGIIFGKVRPVKRPIRFVDRARAAVTSAADTTVGTITVSEGARKIVGICAVASQDGVITTAEELIGFVRLSSDDLKIVPAQFPLSAAISAGLGATISPPAVTVPVFIPVDIPVTGGARIDCFVDLNTAVTNAAEIEIFLAYE